MIRVRRGIGTGTNMEYNLYQLLWFFLIYSFAGWWAGVAFAAVRKHSFINTGFLNSPLCPVYGVGAVLFSIFLGELEEHAVFLFLGGMLLAAVLTYVTGFILERIFYRRWWDFTKNRFQFDGYVSLPQMAACGFAAVIGIRFLNPLVMRLIGLMPELVGKTALLILYGILVLDFIGSLAAVLHMRLRMKQFGFDFKRIDEVTDDLQKITDSLGSRITRRIQKRMMRAYPNLEAAPQTESRSENKKGTVFAFGCCFYKLACLFFLGAFLGDITETIFCYATTGVLMSRSSVVYGPFSIVWGLGCAMLTAFLYKYRGKSDRYIFLAGTLLGGTYEYICSVFTELMFGTVFWDYSHVPFNLGGRINLLYCFFWGIVAVVWLKGLYPKMSSLIERIPKKTGEICTWIMVLFMSVNILVSVFALGRYSERQLSAQPADNAVTRYLDEHFHDERMERIYPNAKLVGVAE